VKIKNLDGAVLITWLGDKTCYLDPEKGEYFFISIKNAARKVKSLARSGNTPAARNLLQVLERTEKIATGGMVRHSFRLKLPQYIKLVLSANEKRIPVGHAFKEFLQEKLPAAIDEFALSCRELEGITIDGDKIDELKAAISSWDTRPVWNATTGRKLLISSRINRAEGGIILDWALSLLKIKLANLIAGKGDADELLVEIDALLQRYRGEMLENTVKSLSGKKNAFFKLMLAGKTLEIHSLVTLDFTDYREELLELLELYGVKGDILADLVPLTRKLESYFVAGGDWIPEIEITTDESSGNLVLLGVSIPVRPGKEEQEELRKELLDYLIKNDFIEGLSSGYNISNIEQYIVELPVLTDRGDFINAKKSLDRLDYLQGRKKVLDIMATHFAKAMKRSPVVSLEIPLVVKPLVTTSCENRFL